MSFTIIMRTQQMDACGLHVAEVMMTACWEHAEVKGFPLDAFNEGSL